MNCPRCQTELTSVQIEDSEVNVCSNCEGTWYPDEALGNVTDHTLQELKSSDLSPSMVGDQLAKVDLDKPICCPECGEKMARYTYSMTCEIVLDECPEHGVWLDDGELGTLMQYLTEMDERVSAKEKEALSAQNVKALEELSKSPTFYSLPSHVLATINSVYTRERS